MIAVEETVVPRAVYCRYTLGPVYDKHPVITNNIFLRKENLGLTSMGKNVWLQRVQFTMSRFL